LQRNLNLTILASPAPATLEPSGRIALSKKFLDGVLEFLGHWPGSITLLMEVDQPQDVMLDPISVRPEDLPFTVRVVSFDQIETMHLLSEASVVLGYLQDRQIRLHAQSRSSGIPWVFFSECSVRTRKQMIALKTNNRLRRWRRWLWEESHEQTFRAAVSAVHGIQCNGTPTFGDYRSLNRNTMLYFDGRVTAGMLPSESEVEKRLSCGSGKPLRLMFSGRLIEIKGADHLLDVALELRHLGVPFELSISGDGTLTSSLQRGISEHDLGDCTKLTGVLDFKTHLVPFLKENVDLFVCCHRQGDPSCTYLETMSCGVPIVGYANEAFVGILDRSRAGWAVQMDRPKLLARKIAELSTDRESLRVASVRALEFGRQHTFEKTFEARARHLEKVATTQGRPSLV
jgi:colanic acid/amylovoran biosynthesis glycosyltransferase